MSITLDYNTSGIPANGLPGWTGIGWTLNTGGVITRTINGLPDEYVYPEACQISDFHNYFESHGRLLFDMTNTANDYHTLKENISCYDYSPDVFYFNFMGKHGSFFLGQDGEWKIQCDENLDVLFDIDNNSNFIYPLFRTCPGSSELQPKCIKGFTLVDDGGIKYVFGGESEGDLDHIEFSISLFHSTEGNHTTCWIPNAWYLKRVEDRFGNILYNFGYERGKFLVQAQTHYECGRTIGNENSLFSHNGDTYSWGDSEFPYNLQVVSPVYPKNIIMTDNQKVEFVMDKSVELSSHDFFIGLYSNYGTSGLYNLLRNHSHLGANTFLKPFYYLQSDSSFITIYQKSNDAKMSDPLSSMSLSPLKCINLKSSGTIYQAFYFKYGLANTSRFHIKEIDIYDDVANYQIALGYSMCYKFRYKNIDLLTKDCLSTAVDHWGYYNAYNSGNGYDLNGIGNSTGNQIFSYRNVNTTASQYGMLTDIVYPTGGCTTLEYEQNDFSSFQSDDRSEMRDSTGIAGGLRIKSITEYEDSTKLVMLGKRTYSYKRTSNISSGELFSRPRYEWNNWRTNISSNASVCLNLLKTTSIIPLFNSFGPHIGYSRVKETNADGTSTVYTFENISSCMEEPFSLCFTAQPSPYDSFSEHGYKRGKMKKIVTMSVDGSLTRSEKYNYESARTDTAYCWTSSLKQFNTSLGSGGLVMFTGGVYKLYYPKYDVNSKITTTDYDGANVVDSTAYNYTDYTFNSQNGYPHQASARKLTSERTFRQGEIILKQSVFKTGTAYKNKYFLPLSSTTTKLNNNFIERKETAYSLMNGHYVPSYEIISTGTSGINDTIITYNDYDSTFRLTKYTEKDGVKVRLFWDSNDRMVARIRSRYDNITYNSQTTNPLQVLTISGLSAFTKKDVESEVYMYNDRGLLKSKTFGNGQTEYYYYDSMNRLSEVRDTNNKDIQRYVYKYKTGIRDTQ